MSDTLDSLHRAVIASPQDRTVRLVYADALDETGDPVHVARAEFVRAQVEYGTAGHDVHRLGELTYHCAELFEAHWLAWWAPVAEAAKLPYPHVPGKRVRDRITRAVGRRRRRPANWPYSHTTADPTVHLVEYGLSFRFSGGFPEDVRFGSFETPEGGPALVHRWGDAMPLVKLSFAPFVDPAQWERIDGPHLTRLTDLTFEHLTPEVATLVGSSPTLSAVTRLTADSGGSNTDAIRGLVVLPSWSGLRALRLTGRLSPDGVRELARGCTLERLEELDLTLGNPGLFGSLGLPANPVVEAAAAAALAVVRMMAQAVAFPGGGTPRWAEYGPALEALAAAPWVRRLRVLRVLSGHMSGLLGMIGERLYGGGAEDEANLIPDAAVLALAAALSPDKLERLVLPAAVVGPSVREELTTRLGGRVLFA